MMTDLQAKLNALRPLIAAHEILLAQACATDDPDNNLRDYINGLDTLGHDLGAAWDAIECKRMDNKTELDAHNRGRGSRNR